MAVLGYYRFSVTGHDSGLFRPEMDFPESVSGLVVMDGIPIYEVLSRADWRFAKSWWHWFLFAQCEKAVELADQVLGEPISFDGTCHYPLSRMSNYRVLRRKMLPDIVR